MDIYQRLKQDHQKQRELAEQIMQTSGDSDIRNELFEAFVLELEAHAAAEEQTLYSALIEKPDGQDQARHSVAEHKTASDLVDELRDTDMSSGAWLQKFKELKHEVLHHLEEEEQEVFPLGEKLIADAKAESLADKFDKRKADEEESMQ